MISEALEVSEHTPDLSFCACGDPLRTTRSISANLSRSWLTCVTSRLQERKTHTMKEGLLKTDTEKRLKINRSQVFMLTLRELDACIVSLATRESVCFCLPGCPNTSGTLDAGTNKERVGSCDVM